MARRNAQTNRTLGQLPQSNKIELEIPDKFVKQLSVSGTTIQQAVIATLKLLLSAETFTPGMHLRPLPQDKSVYYFKAGLDIHITCNLDKSEKGKLIVRLRRIKDHDNLGRNP